MAFLYRKSLITKNEPVLLYFIIDNSDTISVGDALRINTDGHATLAGAATTIAGIVQTVVDRNGIKITPDAGTIDTWTVDADNETAVTKQYMAGICVSTWVLYYNDTDGDLGTTNLLQFCDINAGSNQIATAGLGDAHGQMQIMGVDPDGDGDLSKCLARIAESQLSPHAQV